ncbi:DUF4160 domain-containing protein [Methylosinus sporium]|uniref:DUF4160 domain-containing protein n=1 Tax=Methylosinus sporium TaxID=428 RepID=A0A549T098_METSR|nr:DUF4160 domain-containing protein [Methylosinus sporium]MBU3886950.1 DUF4160 domain-containing protein [Methylosinus sp. KRF6]TRL35304.1 DUF4160 domain-containing protein [Methylosinus sporium]
MPTILRVGSFRFFFYSSERGEPPHIHVESNGGSAKFWLDPVELARSQGFRSQELQRLRLTVIEYRKTFEEAWNARHGRQT